MVIFVGLPLFGLEMAIGQYFAKSPIVLFSNLCPLFCGIGPAMLIMTLIVIIYYNVLLAWTLYYMLVSFSKELPWSKCDFTWGSKGKHESSKWKE